MLIYDYKMCMSVIDLFCIVLGIFVIIFFFFGCIEIGLMLIR